MTAVPHARSQEGQDPPTQYSAWLRRVPHSPGTRHVGTQLLQEALPVPHVQVGASGPDLALNTLEDDLQLAVCLPFEDQLHIGADRGVNALSSLTYSEAGATQHQAWTQVPSLPTLPTTPFPKPHRRAKSVCLVADCLEFRLCYASPSCVILGSGSPSLGLRSPFYEAW